MAVPLRRQLLEAIGRGTLADVRTILDGSPELLNTKTGSGSTLLHSAAFRGNLPIVEYLTLAGLDVNAVEPTGRKTPLHYATMAGHVATAEWLLDHGANVNAGMEERSPTPIISPAMSGDERMVRTLLDRGANVAATYGQPPVTVVELATRNGRAVIVALLQAHSSTASISAGTTTEAEHPSPVVRHVRSALGSVDPFAQVEIVPSGLPIAIYTSPPQAERNSTALFTDGMSRLQMVTPPGGKYPSYAELVMFLPASWPSKDVALSDKRYMWAYIWLRNIANSVHQNETYIPEWLLVSTAEPPVPVHLETMLSCFLVVPAPRVPELVLNQDRTVSFFQVVLLYTEERDFAIAEGVTKLLALLDAEGAGAVNYPHRRNVITRQ